ncbi:hypothetical protein KIN20_024464 [Parelaphostrongylus tenuis]|uniref:Exportin-2 central domain-containing protein n=1 Tax=Parelaphostrongylus tenuis TaxID=148309 RepID=A0AAD5QXL8_PARTN|nr:hypothetical protein KIN20_024464 [Parelaphostrongylus tenuis]
MEVCEIFALYAQRFEEEINLSMLNIIQAVWQLVVQTGSETKFTFLLHSRSVPMLIWGISGASVYARIRLISWLTHFDSATRSIEIRNYIVDPAAPTSWPSACDAHRTAAQANPYHPKLSDTHSERPVGTS